jgi:hypothetical protein
VRHVHEKEVPNTVDLHPKMQKKTISHAHQRGSHPQNRRRRLRPEQAGKTSSGAHVHRRWLNQSRSTPKTQRNPKLKDQKEEEKLLEDLDWMGTSLLTRRYQRRYLREIQEHLYILQVLTTFFTCKSIKNTIKKKLFLHK